MANRRERRRKAATYEVRMVKVDELAGGRCGWSDCGQRFADDLPPSWCWLVTFTRHRSHSNQPIGKRLSLAPRCGHSASMASNAKVDDD
jgi:hypothetical protein